MSQHSMAAARESGIVVSNLAITFGKMPAIFANLDLQIAPGEFVALVGASGCGKTTLMNAIAGLVRVEQGNIQVNSLPPAAGRSDIAYVLARDALLPWRTVRENVEYALMLSGVPKADRKSIALDYIARVDLSAHADFLPARLSHGQRQRVALARAFAVNRSVYMLDEPFSALDAQTKLMLHDQLLALWEQSRKTVIFVTHDIGEAVTLADRVVVMGTKGRGIVDEIRVPLPRPRSASDLQENEVFHEIFRQAWHALRKGMS